MRFISYIWDGARGVASWDGSEWKGVAEGGEGWSGDLDSAIAEGRDLAEFSSLLTRHGRPVAESEVVFEPLLSRPGKIICIGLNYADHTKESPYPQPDYPTVFPRYTSSLVGHKQPIVRPQASIQLDYEGELVAVVGRGGRHIAKDRALDHVAGYSIFNEASIRDYQFKSPQWTVGKNFDDTGAFGPVFVTADEVPAGGTGLRLETHLNGAVVQSSNTAEMIFGVAEIISTLSEAITLSPGDIIATGTPAGVGLGRKPQLWMKHGDLVEVTIEGLGTLSNPVVDEKLAS